MFRGFRDLFLNEFPNLIESAIDCLARIYAVQYVRVVRMTRIDLFAILL
jgi:hypothetical protein